MCFGNCVPATAWTNSMCCHILHLSFWRCYRHTLPGNLQEKPQSSEDMIFMEIWSTVAVFFCKGFILFDFCHSLYMYTVSHSCIFQVPNYLPSISAAISLSPECYIWRFCIGLHSAPRLMVAFTYFRFYKICFDTRFPESPLSCLNLAFSIFENIGLLLLTYVSSSETYCESSGLSSHPWRVEEFGNFRY